MVIVMRQHVISNLIKTYKQDSTVLKYVKVDLINLLNVLYEFMLASSYRPEEQTETNEN